jgi:hypothetical protein
MLNYEPTLPLHPPPRAIPAVVVRAHYTLPGGLVIVVVVHQRRHRPPPPPPSSPSRGWLLLGAVCRHRHPHHFRLAPTQPHQRWCPRCLTSSSSPRGKCSSRTHLLIGIRAHWVSAAVTLRRPAVYPPSLFGPPPPVKRRRRQHSDVDGCPWQPGAATTMP